MNWLQRKIFLYNVTFGLYMLDWWERYLFNTLIIVLILFLFNMGSRITTDFFKRAHVGGERHLGEWKLDKGNLTSLRL